MTLREEVTPQVCSKPALTLYAVPLLVSFTSGEGKVAFSTFRVARAKAYCSKQ